MIDSRNIDDLHPALARGCRELIRRMGLVGYNAVGVSSTYRCIKMQNHLHAQGRTRPGNIVTNAIGGRSWHNWRLAFDIFQNIRGREFNEPQFFETAGRIWTAMGGEWGGNWRNFPDRVHFQMTWGVTISQMQTIQVIKKTAKMPWEADAEESVIYRTVAEMPKWARQRMQFLVENELLRGRSEDNPSLDVSEDMLRILLIVHRMFERADLLEAIAEHNTMQ